MRGPAYSFRGAHIAVLVTILALLIACRREMPAQEKVPAEITLTPSGLAATLHLPPDESSDETRGVVLVHDLGASQAVWKALAARLNRDGFTVITVDLPGHGATPGDWRAMDGGDWVAVAGQLQEAQRALTDAGVDSTRIAYVGAGLGANLALTAAQQTREIAALALVSPGWEVQGVDVRGIVGGLTQRPVLLVAAEGDSYAATTASGMKAEAPGFCELRLYPGTAHGTDLLDTSVHAREQLVEWLKLVL